jgi:hypothetical protein
LIGKIGWKRAVICCKRYWFTRIQLTLSRYQQMIGHPRLWCLDGCNKRSPTFRLGGSVIVPVTRSPYPLLFAVAFASSISSNDWPISPVADPPLADISSTICPGVLPYAYILYHQAYL